MSGQEHLSLLRQMRNGAANHPGDLEAGASNHQSSYPPMGQAIARQEDRNI